MNPVLLSARGLCTWFELRKWGFARVGFVRAVDGVSFELLRGESVAIVGESGCGKSTLARTLLGLCRPTRGEISFAEGRLESSRIGYIQQDPYGALPPFMNVRQILAEPLLIHKVPREERERKIRNQLEEVQLIPAENFLSKYPHMLSGGQQQRVVIARATILHPQLLVADEPVSMLDASVRLEILNLLAEIQRARGLTILYITHDLTTVRGFVQKIFVMYAGRFVESAPTEELLRNPRHPYTRALLAAIPAPDPENAKRLRELPSGERPSLLRPPSGCRFHPRCPVAVGGLCEKEDPPNFAPARNHLSACWLDKKE